MEAISISSVPAVGSAVECYHRLLPLLWKILTPLLSADRPRNCECLTCSNSCAFSDDNAGISSRTREGTRTALSSCCTSKQSGVLNVATGFSFAFAVSRCNEASIRKEKPPLFTGGGAACSGPNSTCLTEFNSH